MLDRKKSSNVRPSLARPPPTCPAFTGGAGVARWSILGRSRCGHKRITSAPSQPLTFQPGLSNAWLDQSRRSEAYVRIRTAEIAAGSSQTARLHPRLYKHALVTKCWTPSAEFDGSRLRCHMYAEHGSTEGEPPH